MPSRLTLLTLADNFIRDTRAPFSCEDFESWIKQHWQRKIADATLARLKRRLAAHERLIEVHPNDYLPCRAVLDKIKHVPLAAEPGNLELKHGIFIAGGRLVPFLSPQKREEDLTLLDDAGRKLVKIQKQFYLDDVIQYYRYSGEAHFPDPVHLNEKMPSKSRVTLTVWDLREFMQAAGWRPGDGFKIRLLDYERGVFRMEFYPRRERQGDRLRLRALHIAMGTALTRLCATEHFLQAPLEKQLLHLFYGFDSTALGTPAFSLNEFLESSDAFAILGYEEGGPRFVHKERNEEDEHPWEVLPQSPQGQSGSLRAILEDMGFPFSAGEFTSILHTSLGSQNPPLDKVLNLLFGGKEDRFYDRKQKSAFFRHLRRLLAQLFEDRKRGEPKVVAELREKVVGIKLRLITLLRCLEGFGISLAELPQEMLEQVVELDGFCGEVLPKFQDIAQPPDIKTIRYTRMILNILQPALAHLEEEVYRQLGPN
jgi:hypothetical protein